VLKETQEHLGFIFELGSLVTVAVLKFLILALELLDLILQSGFLILLIREVRFQELELLIMSLSVFDDIGLLLSDLTLNFLDVLNQNLLHLLDFDLAILDGFVHFSNFFVNLVVLLQKASLLLSKTNNLISQHVESIDFGQNFELHLSDVLLEILILAPVILDLILSVQHEGVTRFQDVIDRIGQCRIIIFISIFLNKTLD